MIWIKRENGISFVKEAENYQGCDSPVTLSLTVYDSVDFNRSSCLQCWN